MKDEVTNEATKAQMEDVCWLCRRRGHAGNKCPTYYVQEEHVVESVSAAPLGMRAVFREGDTASYWVQPVLVWATYRVREVHRWAQSGGVYHRLPWIRGLVSGMREVECSLELCAMDRAFYGYLMPGEGLGAEWFRERDAEVPEQYK